MPNASRTRLDPSTRRAQLVDLGLQMLSTRALDQVAIDDIAAEAGISRGLLFHYFPTKRDFHVAVVQAAADDLYARTEPDPALPLVEQLRASLEAYVDYVADNRDVYMALLRGAGGDPAVRGVLDRTRSRFTDRVLDALGVDRPAAPQLRLAARGWVAFTEEATIDWLANDDLDRAALVELLDAALVALVGLAMEQMETGTTGTAGT